MRDYSICYCQECKERLIVTDRGAALCPNGHGKVIHGVKARTIKAAIKAEKVERWLESFPVATKVRGGYSVAGLEGKYDKKFRPKRSDLNAFEKATSGRVEARIGNRIFVLDNVINLPPRRRKKKEPANAVERDQASRGEGISSGNDSQTVPSA